MILRQDYILSQLEEHPNGCTIADLIDMDCHPFTDRSVVVKNYSSKLHKLLKLGLVTRSGRGVNNSPYIWRLSHDS